jgi:type II secretory pathway component HofQ
MLVTAVHDAVQAIGESCDVNLVMPGRITSEVTGKLSRVGCDRALDVVLRSTGLGYEVQDANIVRIAYSADFVREHLARASRVRLAIVDDRLPLGRNVDLDFRQVPVRDMIRLLAGAGGVEVALPDRLDSTVTVHVTHVAWDRALVAILDASGLGYRYQEAGKRLRVAPIAEIDAERERTAPRGFLEVSCTGCVRFAIDGVDARLIPGKPLEIAPGTHTVALIKPSDKATWLVEIQAGKTVRIGDDALPRRDR